MPGGRCPSLCPLSGMLEQTGRGKTRERPDAFAYVFRVKATSGHDEVGMPIKY